MTPKPLYVDGTFIRISNEQIYERLVSVEKKLLINTSITGVLTSIVLFLLYRSF